jgi:hypothetical protein
VLRFTGDSAVERSLAEMVEAAGLKLVRDLAPALDAGQVSQPAAACRAWLGGVAAGG